MSTSKEQAVAGRITAFTGQLARRIHERAVAVWAAADDGEFPTYDDALAQAFAETEVLCRGLGEAGALSPMVLDQARRVRPRLPRPPLPGDGDGDGDWDDL